MTNLWVWHCKDDKVIGEAVQGDIVVGEDVIGGNVGEMGVQKVGQIMLKGLERRGTSPDLHQVSVLATWTQSLEINT